MNITLSSTYAALRNVASFAAGAATFAAAVHLVDAGQASGITKDVSDIVAGLTQAIGGASDLVVILGPMIGAAAAAFAGKSATLSQQLKTVTKPGNDIVANVGPNAPPAAIAVAKDKSVENVVPAGAL